MGFFFQEIQPVRVDVRHDVELLHRKGCVLCSLNKADVISPKMAPSGTDTPVFYCLGEAPGQREDELGEPFVGPSGQLLKKTLFKALSSPEVGLITSPRVTDYFKQVKQFVRFNNVIRTRPPNNRDPMPNEIECCRPSIVKDIEETKPYLIFAVGGVALNWIYGESGIWKWHGKLLPVRVGGHVCWCCPIIHPSSVLQSGYKPSRVTDEFRIFERDIRNAVRFLVEEQALLPNVIQAQSIDDVEGHEIYFFGRRDFEVTDLRTYFEFFRGKVVGFDIETNSDEGPQFRQVRPYGEGSRILSISFSCDDVHVAVGLDHPECKWSPHERDEVYSLIKKFLQDDSIQKVAHNLSFELEWLGYFLGAEAICSTSWHDTAAMAYVLDPRGERRSLDSLCKEYFALQVKSLEPVDVTNLINTPILKVLRYNLVDSIFTRKLFDEQKQKLDKQGLWNVYLEQVRRIKTLVRSQLKGLVIDHEHTRKLYDEVRSKLNHIEHKIQVDAYVLQFRRRFGVFNPASSKDVIRLLKHIIKTEACITDKGESADESVLRTVGEPICDLILEHRSTSKLLSTYIEPFLKESKSNVWPDGKAHPSYNACVTITRRLSADRPSIQNQAKRKHAFVRRQYVAPPGHSIVSVDYGQIEARVIAMASRDHTLTRYLWENYDIHRAWAERFASAHSKLVNRMKRQFPDKDPMSALRQETKNKFVFPAFYGSTVSGIAKNFGLPERLVEEQLNAFWEMFPGVKSWQQSLFNHYYEHGYVSLLTGFRIYAPIERNKLINYPIQGSASDIVVNAMNRLSEHAERTGEDKFQAPIEIHDDLTFYIPEETLDEDISFIVKECCLSPIRDFDFVSVPITVEVSVGKNWYEMKEYGEFSSTQFSDDEGAA